MSPDADLPHVDRTSNVLFGGIRPRPVTPPGSERTKTVVWMVPAPELPSAPRAGHPSGSSAPPRSDADRSIKEQWRRTRERWVSEPRETTVHHEHHHHLHDVPVQQATNSAPDDREIVDAEVVDDVWPESSDVACLPPGANRALGQRLNDPLQSTFQKPRRRNRHD
jgi:hypothetical protein